MSRWTLWNLPCLSIPACPSLPTRYVRRKVLRQHVVGMLAIHLLLDDGVLDQQRAMSIVNMEQWPVPFRSALPERPPCQPWTTRHRPKQSWRCNSLQSVAVAPTHRKSSLPDVTMLVSPSKIMCNVPETFEGHEPLEVVEPALALSIPCLPCQRGAAVLEFANTAQASSASELDPRRPSFRGMQPQNASCAMQPCLRSAWRW